MNLTRSLSVACVVLVAFTSTGVARAQDVQPPRGRAAGADAPVVTPLELERWFDSYVLLQAQETLKLTDAQFPRFLPRLKALQDTRRRNVQARRQIVNELGKLLKATPLDEALVRERLKALHDLDVKAPDELRKAYEGLDEVLDPVQQARFRIFEEVVERRKINLLMKARQSATDAGRPAPTVVR